MRFEPLPHWALLSGSGPSPRYSSRLGYDPVGDRLILFGGFTSPFNINQAADLWPWPLATDAGWLSLGDQSVPRTGDFIYDYRAHRLLYTVNARVWDVGLDATATWNELHPTGSTTSDPGKAFLDPSEDRLVFPFASIALSFTSSSTPPGIECPPPGGWSPGSIRNASFAVSDRVGTGLTYDYVLSCPRAWPGFPIRGLVPVQPFSKAFVSVGIPVPDTAALGDVSFDLQVLAREQAGVDSSCSFTLTGEAPPVVATGSGAQPDRAWVRWRVEDPGLEATVERRSESGPWTAMARLRADAGSSIAYDDRNVEPDRRYYYRVEINEPGREGTFGETRVDVPRWSLDFASDQPNPLRGRFTVQCLFPAPGEARLEAFDLMGRRRFDATQRVQSPTRATFELDTNERLPAGVYFLRLSLAGETRRRTVVLLR